MIQINFTLLVQLVNFLVLLVILNAILYKPILAKMREREARIKSDRDRAGELDQTVQDQERQHEEELAKARQTAAQEKASLVAEAKKSEAEILDKARNEATGIVEEMKESIAKEVDAVRSTLKAEMTPLAESITEKILGRSV